MRELQRGDQVDVVIQGVGVRRGTFVRMEQGKRHPRLYVTVQDERGRKNLISADYDEVIPIRPERSTVTAPPSEAQQSEDERT